MTTRNAYKPMDGDSEVIFEGKKYYVKGTWMPYPTELNPDAKTFIAYAIPENEPLQTDCYRAVHLEAFSCEDGSWDIIGAVGPELEDDLGMHGMLLWNEKIGFFEELNDGRRIVAGK